MLYTEFKSEIEKDVYMHERLMFNNFCGSGIEKDVISYLKCLTERIVISSSGNTSDKLEGNICLEFDGKRYDSGNFKELYLGIKNCEHASCLKLDIFVDGVVDAFAIDNGWEENSSRMVINDNYQWDGTGLASILEDLSYGDFTYTAMIENKNSGENFVIKIIDGKPIDISSEMTPEILHTNVKGWDSDISGINILADFKNGEHPEIKEELRKYILEKLEPCLPATGSMIDRLGVDGYENALLVGYNPSFETVEEIKEFFDGLEKIVEPLKDEVEFFAETVTGTRGAIFLNYKNFGVVAVYANGSSFEVVGTFF